MASITEIETQTLRELGVLMAGETADGEDAERVEDEYSTLYEELRNKGLATWTSTDDIPGWATRSIVVLLAYRLSREYGINEQRRSTLYFDALSSQNPRNAMLTLARQLENDSTQDTVRAVYY